MYPEFDFGPRRLASVLSTLAPRRPLRPARPALPGRTQHVHLDPRGTELLFHILTEHEERASVAVASNALFSEWGQTFEDPRLAVVDRLTFRTHIVETGSGSLSPPKEVLPRPEPDHKVGPVTMIKPGST